MFDWGRDPRDERGAPTKAPPLESRPVAGIAKFHKPVINVTDLDEGERFWSAVSGLPPAKRNWDKYSVLDTGDRPPDEPWILLQLVPAGQTPVHGGTHLDFKVDDVADAARQIEEIGGVVVMPPRFHPPEAPVIEWAVMQDPFGNEFCLVKWPLQ